MRPVESVVGAGMEPASTSTWKPVGKTTVAELPAVASVANAQTGKDTSESPMRMSRVALPPLSAMSKRSVYRAVLPLYRRPARFSWRVVWSLLFFVIRIVGFPAPAQVRL